MDLRNLQKNWDLFAERDPLFAVVSWPHKRGRRWDERDFFRNGRDEVRAVMADLSRWGHPKRRGAVLDFGCGVGRLTRAFSTRFVRAVGVDVSPRMLELAQGYDRRGRCEFILNPRPDLSIFPDDSFDLVYSNITLQHMPPSLIRAYVREFVRVLSPGGIALFQIPAGYRPSSLRDRLKWALRRRMPTFLWSILRQAKSALTGEPLVEMNVVPREIILKDLDLPGVRVLEVAPDPHAGPEWPGYRYAVLKTGKSRRTP